MCSSNPYPRELPKTQTTSLLAARFQRFSPRWSAFWAPHYLEPATRRQKALHGAKPPPPPVASALQGGGRAWLQRPRAAAGPGRASRQRASTPSAAGVEGAGGSGGPGRGARGRRQGLAGPTPTGTHSDPAPLVWRAPEGPEGTGGLRGAAPNEVRPPSLAGGRALRRPEHPWGHKQPGPAREARRSSPSEPCARAGASRPGRSECGPRCAAPRLRYR